MDYKIKELKNERGPKEYEIQLIKEQLKSMKSEIESFQRTNSYLKLGV